MALHVTSGPKKLAVALDTGILAVAKDAECDPRNLYAACFDGLMTMAQKASDKASKHGLKAHFGVRMAITTPSGTWEGSLNLNQLYELLASELKSSNPNFADPEDCDGKAVYAVLLDEKVLERTRSGWTMRHDPNRPAYAGKRDAKPTGFLG